MSATAEQCSGWTALLDELEASIADAECGGTGHAVDLQGAAARLGPLPEALASRAAHLAGRAGHLVERLSGELREVEYELDRLAPRRRAVAPPAPSHLDQLA